MDRFEIYHFLVVCPNASGVFLLGDFNGWSTSATPMTKTEADIWQIDLRMAAGQTRFSYFVVDERWRTGRAPFGNTFTLPGTWAKMFRTAATDASGASSEVEEAINHSASASFGSAARRPESVAGNNPN